MSQTCIITLSARDISESLPFRRIFTCLRKILLFGRHVSETGDFRKIILPNRRQTGRAKVSRRGDFPVFYQFQYEGLLGGHFKPNF